ncbi:MAG TPA: MarR family transcriptional regulator [Longimicrobiaceae bacterium]|jgi:DNA-binding transcriptional regulator GbsR (MarR family)|nr:MarR family transcriptional regulator [Longimicrobiaceae bacterium]
MNDAVRQFVEKMALLCEKEGMARIAGRILGLLLVEDGPFSLDELAERLQASKASVSTNARMLEHMGMVRRVSNLGDRRDFYHIEADPWERMLEVGQGRWREMTQLFGDAAASLPEGMESGRERLRLAESFHTLLLQDSARLVERWRSLRADERAGGAAGEP